jgi:G3E family GTPase
MVGGFLGAGKTTAIRRIAGRLAGRGLRVGLIANDQGQGLVDTLLLGRDFPVEEITDGCFCCRFDSLAEALSRLCRNGRLDVVVAEPVGSCTDLVAAVSFPLGRLHGAAYRVAPLGVLVDPLRAERMLGLELGPSFSPQVRYVYRKQLEEADTIVVNKSDLVAADRLERLAEALGRANPRAEVRTVSARTGAGIDAWADSLAPSRTTPAALDLDYRRYAEGEALLGWLNAAASIRAAGETDGNRLLKVLAASIRRALGGVEIAHLKMTLAPDERRGDIAALSLVNRDAEPEAAHTLKAPLAAGELVVNLRAECAPEALIRSVTEALAGCGWHVAVRRLDSFRPALPEPTHRMTDP